MAQPPALQQPAPTRVRLAYTAIVLVVVLNSASQVLLKFAAQGGPRSHVLFAWLFNPFFVGALACLGVSFLAWSFALRYVPLSRAHPLCALAYVLTPAAGIYYFGERVSLVYLLGIVCICFGISIISTTKRTSS